MQISFPADDAFVGWAYADLYLLQPQMEAMVDDFIEWSGEMAGVRITLILERGKFPDPHALRKCFRRILSHCRRGTLTLTVDLE
jgi:hypothetical protein